MRLHLGECFRRSTASTRYPSGIATDGDEATATPHTSPTATRRYAATIKREHTACGIRDIAARAKHAAVAPKHKYRANQIYTTSYRHFTTTQRSNHASTSNGSIKT